MSVGRTLAQNKDLPMPQPSEKKAFAGMGQTKSEGAIMQILSNPAVQAFLIQGGLSAMASGNLGKGISDGAAAVGRMQANKDAQAERDRNFSLEERKVALMEQSAAKAGKGGGGGKAPKEEKGLLGAVSPKDLRSLLEAEQETLALNSEDFVPMSPIELSLLAEKAAIASKNGMNMEQFLQAWRANPRAAASYADTYYRDPAAGKAIDEEFRQSALADQSSPPQVPMGAPEVGAPVTPPITPTAPSPFAPPPLGTPPPSVMPMGSVAPAPVFGLGGPYQPDMGQLEQSILQQLMKQ